MIFYQARLLLEVHSDLGQTVCYRDDRIYSKHYLVTGLAAKELIRILKTGTTVLPAKSVSDVMFCLQSYQGLTVDRSLVY